MEPDIVHLTLTGLRARLRSGELSAVEVTEAYLRSAASLDRLNVYAALDADRAVADARRAQRLLAEPEPPPLAGVPVAIKDLIDVAGYPTRAGSPLTDPDAKRATAFLVARLENAGAVVLGKTATHEWALGTTTANPHFGVTRNPWDESRIPGGSSGGNGAGLAARLFPGAVGTDTGGSVRIPAALCGVVGFKPTRGRISLGGVVPLSWTLDHAGPMARTAADARLLLEILTGYDAGDPASRSASEATPGGTDAIDGLRVGVLQGYFDQGLAPAVEAGFRAALRVLEQIGLEVIEAQDLRAAEAARANGMILLSDAAAYHAARLATHPAGFGADVRARLETGRRLTSVDVAEAHRYRALWRRRCQLAFADFDLMVAPSTRGTAPPIEGIDGVAAARDLTSLTCPFNLAGVPSVSVPCGFDEEGLPMGFQIVGPEWSDALVLRVAEAYQSATAWHDRLPPAATGLSRTTGD